MMEATLIQTNKNDRSMMDLKIYDEEIVHTFTIIDNEVIYLVRKHHGELVARSTAEVTDFQMTDSHINSMTVRTLAYDFEIIPGPDYTYRAYKTLRHA
jgi:hypothetical protein